MIIALQLHSVSGTGCFSFFPPPPSPPPLLLPPFPPSPPPSRYAPLLSALHIVCKTLRAGMWETVVIKVFCNSIKVSPQAQAAILHLFPLLEELGLRLHDSPWPQDQGPPPLADVETGFSVGGSGFCLVKM